MRVLGVQPGQTVLRPLLLDHLLHNVEHALVRGPGAQLGQLLYHILYNTDVIHNGSLSANYVQSKENQLGQGLNGRRQPRYHENPRFCRELIRGVVFRKVPFISDFWQKWNFCQSTQTGCIVMDQTGVKLVHHHRYCHVIHDFTANLSKLWFFATCCSYVML